MRVGVIQSNYLPWRGYFDFIRSVDLFVFYDDVQYTKNDWRNRNKIKTARGAEWITVPVFNRHLSQLICESPIDHASGWGLKHRRLLETHYKEAPHRDCMLSLVEDLGTGEESSISELNIGLIRRICAFLHIPTPTMLSSDLELQGRKSERLISLLKHVGATTYLSGPAADAYLDKDAFRQNGIALEYKSYDYAPYPQLWGGFDGALTILDLIANCGPEAEHNISSQTPDRLAVQ